MYDANLAIEYAYKWAYERNPRYYDFQNLGGDCTNFISQCIYAGCGRMNYTRDTGWYYVSSGNRSASWCGVEYLYKFLTTNKGTGPFGVLIDIEDAGIGDIIQLSFDGIKFTHSSIIVAVEPEILVAQHSADYWNRPLSEQVYKKIRVLRILGCR